MDHFVVAAHVLFSVMAEWMMSRRMIQYLEDFLMTNIRNESEIQNSD